VITVVGVDGTPVAGAAAGALAEATLVAGAARHLDALPLPAGARTVEMGDVRAGLDAVAAEDTAGGCAVVLASGDPGYFGIVRLARARGLRPRVVPAVSSVALAFARLGLPWDEALVLSAHGRACGPVLAAALAHPTVAVLTAPGSAEPAVFAVPLAAAGREVWVAERLGTPQERVARFDPARAFPHPNVVVALSPAGAPGTATADGPSWRAGGVATAPDGWALPESAFGHRDSMVTKAEVRALVLARLGPRPGVTVWDVGAGSGSVAVECARFGADVLAVERDAAACTRIAGNAAAHGVRVEVVSAAAPGALAGLRAPGSAFVGGGGVEVLRAVAAVGAHRLVAALAALDRVPAAQEVLREAGYDVDGVLLQAARLAPLAGATRLAAPNPVFVLSGVRGGAAP